MKTAIRSILICLFTGLSGCATYQSLGEVVDDPAQRAALLQSYRKLDTSKAVFRTVLRWPGREISLVEVVQSAGRDGISIVGMTDIGTTLYGVRIDPNGQGRVLSKNLPFSNQWLLDNLVAELLIPWRGPSESCQLRRLPDKTLALVHETGSSVHMFVFDDAGHWCQFRRLQGRRLLVQAQLEWDAESVPKVIRIDNMEAHYHVIRERAGYDSSVAALVRRTSP